MRISLRNAGGGNIVYRGRVEVLPWRIGRIVGCSDVVLAFDGLPRMSS